MQLMHRPLILMLAKRTFVPMLCALAVTTGLLAQMRPQSQSASGAPSVGQGIVFLVRHAERADAKAGGLDPGLSEVGRTRAISLATLLKEAGITAIFTTDMRRARETAAPLANSLGITPATVGPNDLKGLIPRLRRTAGNALVVGHSNTLPDVISELGVPGVYIGDNEYDNLFIVTPATTYGATRLIRLHYR
jgi:phosphohistidine phosphatase SixA